MLGLVDLLGLRLLSIVVATWFANPSPIAARIIEPTAAAAMSTTPAPPEDQARLLEDALVAVRQQTAMMRKCLDTPGKLMDALKCW